jgi:hypothetical protein
MDISLIHTLLEDEHLSNTDTSLIRTPFQYEHASTTDKYGASLIQTFYYVSSMSTQHCGRLIQTETIQVTHHAVVCLELLYLKLMTSFPQANSYHGYELHEIKITFSINFSSLE